jgi:hypothetical protein
MVRTREGPGTATPSSKILRVFANFLNYTADAKAQTTYCSRPDPSLHGSGVTIELWYSIPTPTAFRFSISWAIINNGTIVPERSGSGGDGFLTEPRPDPNQSRRLTPFDSYK